MSDLEVKDTNKKVPIKSKPS